jgi:hypothetical protein
MFEVTDAVLIKDDALDRQAILSEDAQRHH